MSSGSYSQAQTRSAARYVVFRSVMMLPVMLCMCVAHSAWALDIGSVQVNRVTESIVINGNGFTGATSFMLGGVAAPSVNISATQQLIPFGPEVASAVMWRGSYKLIGEDPGGTVEFSVYIADQIDDPAPPPPPPPGGVDCPCIAGWEASSIPKDNFTWCNYGTDGTQSYILGARDSFTISALFDPNDVFFDVGNPGNSTSICALDNGGSYTVAEPLVNQDQYDDCENWLWINICL